MRKFLLFAAAAVLSVACNSKKDIPLLRTGTDPVLKEAFDSVFTDIRLIGVSELHSLVVVKDGKVIYERYAEGQKPDYLHVLWSASKTFAATAIGFAVQDGLLSVDDKVVSFFGPDELPEVQSDTLKELTVKNLLTMSSGLEYDYISDIEAGVLKSPLKSSLSSHFIFYPGTQFKYNSINTYILSAIVTKVTGKPASDYLDEKMFTPLGIRNYVWEQTPEGYSMGGWGLHVTTESFAKAGMFFLQRGKWNGKQILDEKWFDEAMSVQISSANWNSPSTRCGYGYQMWACTAPGVFRFDGAWGQYCLIMPDKNAVVACNSHLNDGESTIQSLLRHVYKNL